ncbi:hypothetical protein GLYMA_10G104651v4 [Glycine max]|uniref:Transmembrane protein n=1 Tax=Glycine soja TaxID=3848 RepID=A0A0B2R5Q8_GLYSO|nr:uncharacterized protein LOC102663379 isoform X1 [Glycine max]XP_028183136.1 uncharacterized protein LOC114370044 isoform X1 [Glycine soja]XP_040862062.1 uncharacterized protein LOC102663379 isoform X1 [Glycine max]KAG4397204.1 hypothetical protein GLYMA_10G104651v4 [Glycine max]KAH1137621.1 hypothetical protein GYH30_027578 [Glycine max]KHN27167.1 hypothetical protein glysoja_039885 [Glycine soja]|eukprot:XP_014618580.1 uncharacterized protein LOC102663379 isoform X1 [Glycine max]
MTNTIVGLKPSLSLSLSIPLSHSFPFSSPLSLKPHPLFLSPKPHPFLKFANNNNNNELREQGNTQQQQQQKKPPNGSKEEEEEEKVNDWSNQRRTILGFNWRTLLDPDPDNVLALGLTGILTWASVQVLWQLLFISLAILTAAINLPTIYCRALSLLATSFLFFLLLLLLPSPSSQPPSSWPLRSVDFQSGTSLKAQSPTPQ